jgi:hypothetical protein
VSGGKLYEMWTSEPSVGAAQEELHSLRLVHRS